MNVMTKILSLTTLGSALALGGCVTNPQTGQQEISKTALYGVGGAVTCGIVGKLVAGNNGARNSAIACGVVGAGAGAYMDYQEKLLRDKLANTPVQVERQGDQIKLVMPENVTFATNSAQLDAKASASLDQVAQVLAKYTDTTIRVNGYTDSTGSDAINQPLSENRARSVSDYLVRSGVAANRITALGYGSRNPVASNDTVEGRAQNRRVEILVNPKAQ